MSDTIRTPVQQRSIDKKNRIIQAGYELFAAHGYFSTNTAAIAKRAGVSTGIVYGYFHDKKDILVAVLDIYAEHVFSPFLALFDELRAPIDLPAVIDRVLEMAEDAHRNNAAIHEALNSLTHVDKDVCSKFMALEAEVTQHIVAALRREGLQCEHLTEKVHWAFESVQSHAHECVFDQHAYIDYSLMRSIERAQLLKLFDC